MGHFIKVLLLKGSSKHIVKRSQESRINFASIGKEESFPMYAASKKIKINHNQKQQVNVRLLHFNSGAFSFQIRKNTFVR